MSDIITRSESTSVLIARVHDLANASSVRITFELTSFGWCSRFRCTSGVSAPRLPSVTLPPEIFFSIVHSTHSSSSSTGTHHVVPSSSVSAPASALRRASSDAEGIVSEESE